MFEAGFILGFAVLLCLLSGHDMRREREGEIYMYIYMYVVVATSVHHGSYENRRATCACGLW